MSDGDGTENRLGRESSPYLQLHRHNPVDWYPWGDEALERARREDKPIFLSVGYSTCYWCHVMERESFASPDVAALMNREFVNIKLDREERPDLDEIYMTATQVLTGHGGWPNSVFLNGRLEPFFAGTYFPPEDRHGLPSFTRVLTSLADAWKGRRGEIDEQAASVAGAVRRTLERRSAPTPTPPGPDLPRRSLVALERRFDARWGGFGGAPKFPTPANLFLLHELADVVPRAGEMLTATLDAMARGGICDQVGGGFHRYATDAEWKIPHFEKMLYDNGQLLELYALEWQRTGDAATGRVVRETAAFLERELTSPDGAFWSAMDAETDGEEGAFYVWTRQELDEVLGAEDAAFLAPLLGFDQAPFFEGDRYVLHLPRRLDEQARARRVSEEALLGEIAPLRRRLLERRRERPELLIDEKILVDWNGMVIAGLATAARLLPQPELLDPAVRAAESLLRTARAKDGTLLHAVRDGAGSIHAFLSDYAFLSHGLLALHEATGDERWLRKVIELVEEQDRRLGDPLGGFFSAAEDDDLLVRSKELVDGAVPAANAMAVLNLLALAERTGEERWREMASRALRACAVIVEQQPEGARMMAVAVSRYHRQADSSTSAGRTPLTEQAIEAVRIRWTCAPVDGEGWRRIEVELQVAEGLHLQAHPASADYLVATTLIGEDVELDDLAYPEGHPLEDGFAEEPIDVYSGTVRISGKVRGDDRLFLIYQACSATGCLPPVRLPLGTPDEESGG